MHRPRRLLTLRFLHRQRSTHLLFPYRLQPLEHGQPRLLPLDFDLLGVRFAHFRRSGSFTNRLFLSADYSGASTLVGGQSVTSSGPGLSVTVPSPRLVPLITFRR